MPVSEVMEFSGGISTATSPHLIPVNEALVLVNADVRSGRLASLHNQVGLYEGNGRYFFKYIDKIYQYNNLRSNVIWDGKWYWADGTSTKKMYPDRTEHFLGLESPNTTLTITSGSGTKPLTGTFTYAYTYYDKIHGVESAPGFLSNSLTVTNTDIVITGFQTLHPDGATNFRLYRVGGYLSEFTLVETLPLSTTTYTDTLDVANIDGRLLQTLRTSPPPDGLQFLIEFNGRLYGAVGNKVYYSALGNPDSWYTDDYYVINNTVSGLGTVGAGIVVFTKDTTNVLRGSGPENFFLKELSSSRGCISHFSIAQYQDIIIWLSGDAFLSTEGYSITDITSHKIRGIGGMYPRGTAVKNLTYLMSFGPILTPKESLFPSKTLYPNIVIGGSVLSEGIVSIDFSIGRQYSYWLIEAKGVGNIGIIDSHIYAGYHLSDIAFTDYNEPMGCNYFLPLTDYVAGVSLEIGSLRTFKYISPMLIDGSYATLKEYEKVRIVYKGHFTVSIIIDSQGTVLTQEFDDESSTDGFIILGIPNSHNKGYGIQLQIEGEGYINAIQYTWQPRSLP